MNKLSIYVVTLKKSGLGKSCGFRAELDPSLSFFTYWIKLIVPTSLRKLR